ncbi:DsbA family oxidoreductase [Bacillus sp. SM2101]|uniref:DsbA family oxidoreductase n=1 Tax=Bacillaceae TaxID=186817 RepID=UPI001BDF05A0|nr:DsbA family oxidoreductase [Bacillus sp. SM2101]
MKIEVYSDFVCPFCYIGKRHLEDALERTSLKNIADVSYKSFELDPNSPRDTNLSIHEIIANKYGVSIEQAKQNNEGIRKRAEEVGLDFRFENMLPTNTFEAHRLAKYASVVGKEEELTEKLLKAYFTDSKHIGDHSTLLDIAEDVGLDREQAKSVLESEQYKDEVRSDESEARSIGVQGVPFFVINDKYAISGAQPTEVFVGALEKVLEEEKQSSKLTSLNTENAKGTYCDDNGCE